MARVLPTVDQIDRGLVLCMAGDRAHLAGQVGRAGVAGGDGNHDDGSGRSSGVLGFGVREHGRRSWCMRSAPGSTVRTATRSKAGGGSSGRGSDMARRQRDSGTAEEAARGRERARGGGEKAAGLTVDRTEGSASSGKAWTALEPRRRSSDPRMKMTSMAMMQGTRRLVA